MPGPSDRAAEPTQSTRSRRERLIRHEGLRAAVAYGLVLCFAYSNVVFSGESLAYSNNYNLIPILIAPETHGPHARQWATWTDRNLSPTPNMQDPSAALVQWETAGSFFLRSLWQGDLPFWDPYTGAGVPAMANLVPAFFFPPYLVLIALGNGILLKNIYFLALLLMAGWCTWALLRRHGLSWPASFVGGLAFMLSGGLIQNTGSFIGQTACCLPLALLATHWFLQRSTWSAAAGLAAIYAAIALASFPPVLMAIFGLSAAYAAAVLVFGATDVHTSRWWTAARFSAATLLAGGLVAFYYLPLVSLMGNTPQVAAFYSTAAAHTHMLASDLLQLLAPALMGGAPIWQNDPVPRHSAGAFHYVGVVALALAALTDARRLRQPLWLTTAVAIVIVLGLMLEWPLIAYLRELPVLRNIHFGNYFGIALDFLIALLAAAGFERLRDARLGALRAWMAASIVLLAVIAVLLVAIGMNVPTHAAFPSWRSRYLVVVVITFVAATAIFIAAAAGERRGRAVMMGWMLTGLLVAEGVWNAHFPRQARWDLWSHPPGYIQYLQKEAGLGRVFNIGNLMYANSGSAFGVYQVDSMMAFNPPRMFDLYRRHAKGATPIFLRDAGQVPPESILDAAGVTHIPVPSALPEVMADMKQRGHQAVFFDGYITIFRRAAVARYFFTTAFTVSPKRRALDDTAQARPPREIVVESAPPFASQPNPDADPPVTVERISNNRVRLSVVAPRPGFVYASDAFFDGWSAAVDGRDVPLQPANYAFKAVAVPPGPVTVEFAYRPPGLAPGLVISGVALVAIAGLFVLDRRSRFGSRRDQHLTREERK